MKLSKEAKRMAKGLGLSEVDAYIMELKAKLYSKSSELIKSSKLTNEQIAKQMIEARLALSF